MIPPCGVPVIGWITFPSSSRIPAFNHFLTSHNSALSSIAPPASPAFLVVEVIEEAFDVGFHHVIVSPELQFDRQLVHGF